MDIATILSLVQFAIANEPKVQDALVSIFSKPNPTAADWDAEKANWQKKYEELVPDTKLPPTA